MKKSVKKIGLCAITCAMLASYMSCINPSAPSNNETPSVENSANNDQGNNGNNDQGSNNGSEDNNGSGNGSDTGNNGGNAGNGGDSGNNGGNTGDNGDSGSSGPTAETIQEGWYIYLINDYPQNYIYYDANKNIVRILTLQNELTGDEFNKAKKTLAYDSIKKNLKYSTDIFDLPPWSIKTVATIAVKDENNLYKGLSTSTKVLKRKNNGIIVYVALKDGEIYITPHYYDNDGNLIETVKKPSIVWSIEPNNDSNVDFKKYFMPDTLEDGTSVLKMINAPSEDIEFTVKAYDRTIGSKDENKVIKFTLIARAI